MTYLLNITLHCEASIIDDVQYFLQHRILPTWGSSDWYTISIWRLPNKQGFALQLISSKKEQLESFDPTHHPDLARIQNAYPHQVQIIPTFMQQLG